MAHQRLLSQRLSNACLTLPRPCCTSLPQPWPISNAIISPCSSSRPTCSADHSAWGNDAPTPQQRCHVIQRAGPSHWAMFAAITAAAGKAGGAAAASGSAITIPAGLPALLTSTGIFIISLAGAVFLISAIPTLWALARLAISASAVLRQVEKELPDTAALLRLSGMEMTDCISELSGLGSDLSSGVRSTAKMVTMTETGVKQAVTVASTQLVPALAAGEAHARGAVEAGLQQRAKLDYTLPVISQVAGSTTRAVRRLRLGLVVANLASTALQLGRAARSRTLPTQPPNNKDG